MPIVESQATVLHGAAQFDRLIGHCAGCFIESGVPCHAPSRHLFLALFRALGLPLNAHGHAHLHAHGHPFVDARTLQGMPNAMDVLTNAPLAPAGFFGLLAVRGRTLPDATRQAALVFFAGLLATGFGPAWYHWAPDATLSGHSLQHLTAALAAPPVLRRPWLQSFNGREPDVAHSQTTR
jgi:hypothetical protein